MYQDLLKLLNMSLTGSFIILFVLLARLALRKAPKIYSYALWAVVLFRLLCPVSFSAPVSLLGALEAPAATESHTVEYISPTIVHDAYPAVDIPATTIDNAINAILPQGEEQTVADPLELPVSLATILWLWGMAALVTYSVISLLFLRRKLIGAVPLHGNVYLADHIDSPFVMGLVRPKIYLPSTLSESEQSYILLHERHHIRRGDHVWKLLGFIALCIHWFNPLVWVSFVLATKDMEMSCDEAVLKKMGGDIRADYSASLLSLATGRRIIAGAPLAFGEGDTRGRIKNALKWRESPAWVKALCAVCCGLVVVLCAANPAEKDTTAPEPFGHSYRVVEVLYDNPKTSESFESWVQGAFTLTADYGLTSREGNTWLNIGSFREADLPDTIDAQLRKDNKKAWKCVASEAPATALYYLMHQKDGTVLLAQGYTASPSSPQDTISFVWKLERTDYVTCQVHEGNSTTDLGDLGWYPNGFDFDYDALHTATVYGSGSLGFTVEDAEETLTVEEHYYVQSEEGTEINKRIHTLYPAADGVFYLPVERRNNYDEYAIYCVAHDVGKYIVRVNFPFQADTTVTDGYYVTGEQIYKSLTGGAFYPDGDNGLRYFIYNDTLTVTDRATGASTTYPVVWNWTAYPYEENPITPKIFLEDGVLWQTITNDLALAKIGGQLVVVDNKPELANVFTLVPDTGYIPTSPLVTAVTEVVKDTFFHNNTFNTCGRAHYVILDTRELMLDSSPSSNPLTIVDLLALGMDFQMEDGALTPIREKAMEMTLTFEEQEDAYILTDQESTILADAGEYDLALRQACYSQAVSYFGIDTEAVITKLFDAIASSPAVSSNPGDYIDAHGWEYLELQFYGDYTLRYLFEQFLAGGQTDLKGYLMRILLDDMAPESALRLNAGTGQEYFDAWLEAGRDTESEIGIARMEHEYPAAWLALRMAEA